MANRFTITGDGITVEQMVEVAVGHREVEISPAAITRMKVSYEAALRVASGDIPVYGINTGFGPLKDRRIEPEQTSQLQINLIRSHASGVGDLLPTPAVRGAMLLLASCLSIGASGIDPRIVQLLVEFLNKSIHPVVPSQGSLGASGDLAPLAHVALALIGEGPVEGGNALSAMTKHGLEPASLGPKCGLALINGTHFLTAIGALSTHKSRQLLLVADVAAAIHVEASLSSAKPFGEAIMALRPHAGQAESAANLRSLLAGSALMEHHADCHEVQDAYSVRCTPQVHGAVRDAQRHARSVLETEMRSVTDNPLFVGGQFVSAGNFHGEPCALAMDYLSLGLIELGNISERRTERLVNPTLSRGLPAFLAGHPGLESGVMLAHYAAAALASENKTLAFPPSADTIPTGANQEDHVSMGMTSARRLDRICANLQNILAIELLCAARAMQIRKAQTGKGGAAGTEAALASVRGIVSADLTDRPPSPDIQAVAKLIESGQLIQSVSAAIGDLI
jgi:histidine ammonia-lyase